MVDAKEGDYIDDRKDMRRHLKTFTVSPLFILLDFFFIRDIIFVLFFFKFKCLFSFN